MKRLPPALAQIGSYGLLTLLQKGMGFILLPITTRYLSLAEYGVLESLTMVLVLCSLLEVSAGALPRFAGQQQDRALLSSSLCLSSLVALLLALVVAAALRGLPLSLFDSLTMRDIVLVAITVFVMILLQPLLMWFRVQQQATRFCLLVGCQSALQCGGTLWVLQQGFGLSGILLVSALAHSVSLLLALALSWRSWWGRPELDLARRTLTYQSQLIVASLALFLIHGFDRLLLGQWLGAETLARYGILIKLLEVVAVVFAVAESWWQARRFAIYQQGQGAAAVATILCYLLLLLGLLMMGCLLLAPWLVMTLLPDSYHQGLIWLPALALAMTFKLATAIVDMGCYLAEKPLWLGRINWASALLALLLYGLLLPHYQVAGLLWALNLIYALRLLCFAWLSQRLMPLCWPRRRLVTIVLLLAAGLVGQWLPQPVAMLLTLAVIAALLTQLWLHLQAQRQGPLLSSSFRWRAS